MTQEQQDKQAFFAQYWGQNFATVSVGLDLYDCQTVNTAWFSEIEYLQLRSISQLTDEEKVYLESLPDTQDYPRKSADYLRSIGVAVPFRQYSVEEMIEKNWIKLKE